MAGAARRYAASSLAPGSFAIRQPERSQTTRVHREVAYVSVGARHPTALNLPTNKNLTELRAPEPITHASTWT
jgi:hypothetical protein